jgi:glucose-fructose oxidoreductase
MSKRIRYAVVGLGHIAQVAILPAFAHAENSQLAALITGDPEKAGELSRRYGVPAYSYDDLERAVKEQNVDAVFIAVPNTLHREYTERAAAAGAHVLCEKPMATTEDDCLAMIDACAKRSVKLMIAYRLHLTDAHVRAIDLAMSGGLGELRYFNSLFSMQVAEDNIRVQAENGGGPLFDIGIYCLNASRYLFQDEPLHVLASIATREDPRFAEVEEMASVILRFPQNRIATFTCSFGSSDMDQLDLVGTEGALHLEPAYPYAGELKWKLKQGDDAPEEKTFPPGDQFAGELIYFSNCILEGKTPEPSGEEGLADVRILNAIHKASRTGATVPLEPIRKADRPDASQEIKRPPVAKRELVEVGAPHRE